MVPRLNVALSFRDVHKPLANAILLMVILICPAFKGQVACDLAKVVDDYDFIALVSELLLPPFCAAFRLGWLSA